MKKTYKIEVDCPVCAGKMVKATKELEGVKDADINFMTQKLTVEFDDSLDEKTLMEKVVKTCKKIDSDCEIQL